MATTKTGKSVASKTAASHSIGKKSTTKKSTPQNAAAKKAVAKKSTADKVAAKKAAAKKSVVTRSSGEKAVAKKSTTRKAITKDEALDNTRKLLDAKQHHDRKPKPWQSLDPAQSHVPHGAAPPDDGDDGSTEARSESRIPDLHGAAGNHARSEQGKRDKR